jgi:hypothetical protein
LGAKFGARAQFWWLTRLYTVINLRWSDCSTAWRQTATGHIALAGPERPNLLP